MIEDRFDKVQKFTADHVTKYVFEKINNICIESVLYHYSDRTVLCISTQCGCPCGCVFCGTGKRFIRNLSTEEIINQVRHITDDIETIGNRFQIMFMSMGEPFLNYEAVKDSLITLRYVYPKAELLISTIGPRAIDYVFNDFLELSHRIPNIGLQFSMHSMQSDTRDKIIPFSNKLTINNILQRSLKWNKVTGRPVFWNFILTPDNKAQLCCDIYDALVNGAEDKINLTFSVECPLDGTNYKPFDYKAFDYVQRELQQFNTRMFNPEGQDTIGAGCGQLWYVQQWMKDKNQKLKVET